MEEASAGEGRFTAHLGEARPPADWAPALKALWHLERDEWDAAHGLVQEGEDSASAWVHAHIHRIEGDDWNARYWYRRAGQAEGAGDFGAERRRIAATLLAAAGE